LNSLNEVAKGYCDNPVGLVLAFHVIPFDLGKLRLGNGMKSDEKQ
jgi:hypothetical protein